MLTNLQFMHLRLLQKEQLKTTTGEATGDLIGNKLLIKLQKYQEVKRRLIQKQLQISMIKKYLNNHLHLGQKFGLK